MNSATSSDRPPTTGRYPHLSADWDHVPVFPEIPDGQPDGTWVGLVAIDDVEHWDDPEDINGDAGWTVDSVEAAIRTEGFTTPVTIGRALTEPEGTTADSDQLYVFNGNHRLAAARRLGMTHLPYRSSIHGLDDLDDQWGLNPIPGLENGEPPASWTAGRDTDR